MIDATGKDMDQEFLRRTVEVTVRIGLVLLIAVWCFNIIAPFIHPIAWGGIIAVATYPIYMRLVRRMKGSTGKAAVVFTLIMLAIILVPVFTMSTTTVDSVQTLSDNLSEGTVTIPPPSDKVRDWPLIGEKTHALWSQASTNLEATLKKFNPELKALGAWLLKRGVSVGSTILMFIVSIIIAGVFLAGAEGSTRAIRTIACRLVGERGDDIAALATATVRSVASGVLGVALIQSVLAGIGLVAIGVPGAGLWALLVLLVAIIQLPPLIVLGPIIAYVFSVEATTPAMIFMVYSVIVSFSDGFLKPLLLGRGVEVPMLVILLGAIGGMIMSGIIGLFVGSIVLALGYKLFMAWLYGGAELETTGEDASPEPSNESAS